MRLDPDDIEAIAHRVAELLNGAVREASVRLVDASQLAGLLGVDREWIYAHARQLGAIRLGGRQGRLRFDLQRVLRSLEDPERPPAPPPPTKRRRSTRGARSSPTTVDLLPYDELRSARTQGGRAARQRPRP